MYISLYVIFCLLLPILFSVDSSLFSYRSIYQAISIYLFSLSYPLSSLFFSFSLFGIFIVLLFRFSPSFDYSFTLYDLRTLFYLSLPYLYFVLFNNFVPGCVGSIVAEITRFTGAKITVSRKGEFIEGTMNRSVTIVGTPNAAQAAHQFISEKVKQAALDQAGR